MVIVAYQIVNGNNEAIHSRIVDCETNETRVFPSVQAAKDYLHNYISNEIVWDGNNGKTTLRTWYEDIVEPVTFNIILHK